MTLSRRELAAKIDHTNLQTTATTADIEQLCREAVELATASVCVSPTYVEFAVRELNGRVPVCSVVGFPSGAHTLENKRREAAEAVKLGATEIDMVINRSLVKNAAWSHLFDEISAVRSVVPGILKVIFEYCELNVQEQEQSAKVAIDAGADFLKTSTGFGAQGASVEIVSLYARLAAVAGRPVGVKASGGIRTTDQALAMIDAGATRIGTSRTASVLGGLTEG